MHEEMILGSECKVLLDMPVVCGVTPYEYDFEIELYTNPKKRHTIGKDYCFPVGGDDYNFLVPFNSADVGIGEMTVEIVAHIPDPLFKDGLRTERIRIESVTTIIP